MTTTIPISDTVSATVTTDRDVITTIIGKHELTDYTVLKLAATVLDEAMEHIEMDDELHAMVRDSHADIEMLLNAMRRD